MRLIVLIVLLASYCCAFGQTLHQSFELAESLFKSDHFAKAKDTYERVLFFDKEDTYKQQSLVRIADCYLALSMPNKAFKALDAAIIITKNNIERNDLILSKSLELIQQKMWFRALEDLYSLNGATPEQSKTANYLTAVAHFGYSNYTESKKYFLTITSEGNKAEIDAIFEKAERKLNPKRADRLKTLSLFIPGSGQIIAGNAKSGINSLLLIGGLSAFYISTARQYGTISAAITVLPWLSRYHVGGSENAQDSMLKRQEKLKSQYFDELIRIVRS